MNKDGEKQRPTDYSVMIDLQNQSHDLCEDFQGFVQDRLNEPGINGSVEVFATVTPATERERIMNINLNQGDPPKKLSRMCKKGSELGLRVVTDGPAQKNVSAL